MGRNMLLEDLLVEENLNIRAAIERLEKIRCKVVYVVNGGKLAASVSDGDVRRYALSECDMDLPVKYIAKYTPTYLLRYEK